MIKPVIGSLFVTTNHGKKIYRLQWEEGNKRKTKSFPKTEQGKTEAIAFAKKIKKIIETKATEKTTPFLPEAINEYIRRYKVPAAKKGEIKIKTYKRILHTMNNIPLNLQKKRLGDITPDDIQDAYNELSDIYSQSQIVKTHDLLYAVFKNAEANRIIKDNPFRFIKRPRLNTKEKEIYTKEEIFIICNTIRKMKHDGKYHSLTHDYYLLFRILITTGLRIGEALTLKWSDFDLDKKKLTVQRTYDEYGTIEKTGTTKTKAGYRIIPILSERLLKRLKKNKPENEDTWLFGTTKGKPLAYYNFHRAWSSIARETASECPKCHHKRSSSWKCSNGHEVKYKAHVCKKCGEERERTWVCPECGTIIKEIHKTPHTTRHTFCSHLMEKDINIMTIKYIAGHAQASTTMNIYGHITENMDTELYQKAGIK